MISVLPGSAMESDVLPGAVIAAGALLWVVNLVVETRRNEAQLLAKREQDRTLLDMAVTLASSEMDSLLVQKRVELLAV